MKLLLVLSLIAVYLMPLQVSARSGCCSWHGGVAYCDTSVGTYVCNDGSYSPSCGCAYYPPKPVCPEATVGSGSATFEANGCNQNIYFSWNKGINDDFYSVGLSKYRGADPGPKSDTTNTYYTFENVKPGKWYVNVKPGKSCGWSGVYSWEVNVPEVKPQINFNESVISEDERALNYSVSCAQKAEIDNGIGKLKTLSGTVTIKPTESNLYTLTAYNNGLANSSSVSIAYPLPKPQVKTPEITQAIVASDSTDESTGSGSQALLWAVAGGGGLWAIRRYFSGKGVS